MRFLGREWQKDEIRRFVGDERQLGGVWRYRLSEGPGDGTEVIEMSTATGLRWHVLPSRALDIGLAQWQGMSLAWCSPAGYVAPERMENGDNGWLRSFAGGLLTTCGLDNVGPACQVAKQRFGLHGRISGMRAEEVSARGSWQGDEYQLSVSGRVRQAALFNEKFELKRRISSSLDSCSIQVEDEITNIGFRPAPLFLLYHCNLGFPLINPKTRLEVTSRMKPRDEEAEKGVQTWQTFADPDPDFQEQVFYHWPQLDRQGRVQVRVNPGVEAVPTLILEYDGRELPRLVQWKMCGAGEYVLGFEPANCWVAGRAEALRAGDYELLEPGQTKRCWLRFTISSDL